MRGEPNVCFSVGLGFFLPLLRLAPVFSRGEEAGGQIDARWFNLTFPPCGVASVLKRIREENATRVNVCFNVGLPVLRLEAVL